MSIKLRIAAAACLAALIAAAPCGAQAAAGAAAPKDAAAGATLGLAEARKLALASSRSLRKALLGVDAAVLAAKATKYDILPSISASAKAGLSYSPDTALADGASASAGLSIAQTIYDGGRNAALAAIDAIDDAIARAEARSAWFDAVAGVESAYYTALKTRAAEKAAEDDLAASRAHIEIAKVKLEVGMIAKAAFLEVESELASKESALSQARKARIAASLQLAALTGKPASIGLEEPAGDDLAVRFAALGDDRAEALTSKLLAQAAELSPTLKSASLNVDLAKGEIESARRESMPTVAAAWSHAATYDGASGFDLLGGSLSLTASISLDSWTIKNAVEQKKVAAEQAALDEGDERSSLELDLRGAVYEAVANARAIASSRKALDYAEEHYAAQLESFKLGSLSSSDLSDAEVLVSSARSSLIAARYDFLAGLSTIRSLVGLEDEGLLAAALE